MPAAPALKIQRYGEGGMDYGDNLFRFALFAWAALEAPLVRGHMDAALCSVLCVCV